jgi:hypothetical protein
MHINLAETKFIVRGDRIVTPGTITAGGAPIDDRCFSGVWPSYEYVNHDISRSNDHSVIIWVTEMT